ncbi:glutathione S-transferase family protein [Neorhizobium sp. P12A]|jgi:glutathione S-transferase|uniref:glutathione S-transferase family protein n=1 Tax=Rhizobium/Agrobacterium group TaxID=227290 RepID=UPI001049D879|nr:MULTISPECIES: glutathione S-transferase family protein [Rhizobium/Agrobacterium group]KAA0700796.1 glutathione S-transferase family protein [Neorhizobium sp. P12A]TCR91788.1 glutathione S-transferase [Rhizobium sp. BK376]
MRLIGMLDSPYVRRVAISLTAVGIPFEHEPLSVFRTYKEFEAINPVVKAPTLVLDDGTVLMESSLILEYIERLAPQERRLTPSETADFARAQRIVGLALTACEKSVQIVYEHHLRPSEKLHEPWLDRVKGQLLAAYGLLEKEIGTGETWLFGDRPLQADISVGVAWYFTQDMCSGVVDPAAYPALAQFSRRAEALDAFRAMPHEG